MSRKISINNRRGFTLIELLIVIAIIAILGAVVFVALDPLTRFRDTRDARRWSDLTAVLNAIKVDQVDNGGAYLTAVSNASAGVVSMISDGAVTSGCNLTCDTAVTSTGNCVDLSGLASEGYLGDIPVSPNGSGTWTASTTGYTLERETTGIITIRACESENSGEISVSR
ncbi:MAG: prepilin-type N-terminal cleavage/methylation domain-containing protein [bacterium]